MSGVCDYRKETSVGNGDATLPGMSVWSSLRIAGPKSTSTISAKVQVSTYVLVPVTLTALSTVPAVIQELSTVGKVEAS